MNKAKLSFRTDERTVMQLEELAGMMHTKVSYLIRIFLRRTLDELTDQKGNISINQLKKLRK